MFIANIVPPERKEFIHRMGFEFLEIPMHKFIEVAQKYGTLDKSNENLGKSKKRGDNVK